MTREGKKTSRLMLAAASLLAAAFLVLFAEVGLRMAGFRFDSTPRYMEFNFPRPNELFEIFEPDTDTLWKLKPGVEMGPGIEPINSKGFRGPEFSEKKEEGVYRLAALGDSVTFGGVLNYPRVAAKCLGDKWEVINAGVPGYTVFQGYKQFRTRVAALKPDIVTIMFGWNDHWLSRGYTDSQQKFAENENLPPGAGFLTELRVFQIMKYAVYNSGAASKEIENRVYRVPLDEYRRLLDRLVADVKKSGAKPILITAPSALDNGRVPRYLFENGFVERELREGEADVAARLKNLHGKYNDAVRDMANIHGAALIDIETSWYRRGTEGLFRDPSKDIVHPNEEGYRLIGVDLCDKVEKLHQ